MRRIITLLSAAGAFLSTTAHADEVIVSLNSSYVDTTTLNEKFGDLPTVKFEGTVDIGAHAYVTGYLYTGTKSFANDESSEYGLEAGVELPVGKKTSVTLAGGRYANYEGNGFNAGDWYGKVEMSHGRATASATALKGDTDTVLLRVSYSLPAGKKAIVVPSVVYSTEDHRLNPAITLEYPLTDRLSVGAQIATQKVGIFPRTKRKLVAAANVTMVF